jgi:hypothetical protein
MQAFIDNFEVGSFDHIADDEGAVWAEFGITSQPAFAFINDDGTVKTVVSRLGEERLAEEIAALL